MTTVTAAPTRPDPPCHVRTLYLRTQPAGQPYDYEREAPWPEPENQR